MSKDSLLFAMKSLRLSEEQQALPESIMLQAVEPLPTIDLGVQRNLAILSLAGNTPAPDAAQPAAATHPSPPCRYRGEHVDADHITDNRRFACNRHTLIHFPAPIRTTQPTETPVTLILTIANQKGGSARRRPR